MKVEIIKNVEVNNIIVIETENRIKRRIPALIPIDKK